MAEERAKVIATIQPPGADTVAGRDQLADLWAELVAVKAKLAEVINALNSSERARDELERYVRRAVKRIDTTAGRLSRERAALPRIRG